MVMAPSNQARAGFILRAVDESWPAPGRLCHKNERGLELVQPRWSPPISGAHPASRSTASASAVLHGWISDGGDVLRVYWQARRTSRWRLPIVLAVRPRAPARP